jgi:hypothetical protein
MSSSYTLTETTTFTITHARHMAAKVATDLKRLQRLYGSPPSDASIAAYEDEITKLLNMGYLGTATYGYRKYDKWIEPTIRFTARDLAGADADDENPGRIRPGADISGASFYSYMTYSRSWSALSSDEQAAFENTLPFRRTGAPEPAVNGYMRSDRTYSAGGRALDRQSVKAY